MRAWMITFWVILVPVTLIGHYYQVKLILGLISAQGCSTCR